MREIVQTIEISAKKANHSNSTFGFLPTHKPSQKNQKSCFFPTLEQNEENHNVEIKKDCILTYKN
jgi:hypothetical protein